MKRFIALFLSLLLCTSALPAFATVESYYDGNKINLSEAVTYYPALELLEALGADIEMDGNDFTAVIGEDLISYDAYYEELYIGDDYYYEGEAFHVVNDQIYMAVSLIKEIAEIDYTENHELRILSPEAVAEQKARDEKKFNTMYPKLSKALKDLPTSSFEQEMTVEMNVSDIITDDPYTKEEFDSLEELPRIKLTTTMAQDAKNEASHYQLTLETNEYGSMDSEETELIILKDAVFVKNETTWYQESMDDLEHLKLDVSILPFFYDHLNDIKEERISGGIAYTIELEQAPLSVLLDALGDQYARVMEISNLGDEYNSVFENFKWRIVVNNKSQLIANQLEGKVSLYDSWSDSTMILTMDLDAIYDMTKEIEIVSPLEAYKPQNPINLSKLNVSLDGKNITTPLDLKVVDHTILINVDDLNKLFDVSVEIRDFDVLVKSKDTELAFEEYSDEVIINNETLFKVNADTLIEDSSYYVSLKGAVDFLGGLCLHDTEKDNLMIYSPEEIGTTYFSDEAPVTEDLAKALRLLKKGTYKTTRDITFKADNYVNYTGDSYDDYDISYMNNIVNEVESVDPVNKYVGSKRAIKVLGDYEDAYDMHFVSHNDNFYYTFIYDGETPNWYMDENVAYERIIHDEVLKLEKLRPLLKAVNGEDKTFSYKMSGDTLTEKEQVSLGRMMYDGFVLDHLYNFPIESIHLESFEITYKLANNGQIKSQDESYVFKFDDGERTFDIMLMNDVNYSDFNKPVEVFIPEVSEE